MKYAIGVVIDRDLFPDKLFAPAKRTDLMPDGTNPVLDKELRSEIFSQGTLMLRVVIQVSMVLSIPLMAVFCSCAPTRRLITWPMCSRSTCWSARCFRQEASPRSASGRRLASC